MEHDRREFSFDVVDDVNGRLVRTLLDEPKAPGRETVTWAGRDDRGNTVATGVYFYRLVTGQQVVTRKMILLK